MRGLSQRCLVLLVFWCLAQATSASGTVWLIDIQGAIGPATADHVIRGLEQAQEQKASFAVLLIDTPGGLDSAMRTMIKSILAAEIPVVGYVTPQGARAASAGTYILYACHVAAMAPATNLGAATPVQMGAPGMPGMPEESPSEKRDAPELSPAPSSEQDTAENSGSADRLGSPKKPQEQSDLVPGSAMERKIINDAVAYIEGLAKLRGRNSEWASRAVREGVSLSADQAQELNVIDLMATDVTDLMKQLDGRQVQLNHSDYTFASEGAEIHRHAMDWRSAFLAVITNPNVAYILMLIGIYGLIFEFSNPGFGLPGVLGAMCLLIALYAFQVLPVSYAGLGLIILGIGLMTAEAFAPSFGILGLGGVISFVIGSIMLMDTHLPGYQIAMPLILGIAVFSAGLLVFALGMVVKARKRAVVSGLQHLLGAKALVETLHEGTPMVRLDGELWQVHSEQPLQVNDQVTVTAIEGVYLRVSKSTG